jgi:glycosyltransferase involved in cell wall biosynthesis
VELADVDDTGALAGAYRSAWVAALPSVGEAFGLVLAEALACGTPGVGTDDAGIPEVLDRPEVGRLFRGEDASALAAALLEAFELAEDPGTRDACRARAQDFSAQRCGEAYEALYRELLAESRD